MPTDLAYDAKFYQNQSEGSKRSAEIVAQVVLDVMDVKSVCDVGCGVGSWLSAWRDLGVRDFLGVDGGYVSEDWLMIPPAQFMPHDLKKPLQIDRTFDLATSFEVAEHLPASVAEQFVSSLVRLSSAVLFSAAIPGQGGTLHINEQWPEYWAKLFRDKGYIPVDFVRWKIWNNPEVEWWYAQNTMLFCSEHYLNSMPSLQAVMRERAVDQLSVVHPRQFEVACNRVKSEPMYFADLVRELPRSFVRALKNRSKHL